MDDLVSGVIVYVESVGSIGIPQEVLVLTGQVFYPVSERSGIVMMLVHEVPSVSKELETLLLDTTAE